MFEELEDKLLKESNMKQPFFLLLMLVLTLLCSACVSRTYISDDADGATSEKKLLWIWQDEYRNK